MVSLRNGVLSMYHMLIAEDELDEYELVIYLMHKFHFQDHFRVFHADNGKKAMDILGTESIDVLLTDIEMPFVSGLSLAEHARKNNPEMPIIFFSCYDNFSYAKTAIALGANNYMLKPIDPEEFKTTISQTMEILKEQKQKEMPDPDFKLDHSMKHAVQIVTQYIDQHYSEDITLNTLADLVFLNTSYLSTIFKAETGSGINRYIKTIRMEKAKHLISHTNMKISEVASSVGFHNSSYFVKSFHEFFGETPEKMRQN